MCLQVVLAVPVEMVKEGSGSREAMLVSVAG